MQKTGKRPTWTAVHRALGGGSRKAWGSALDERFKDGDIRAHSSCSGSGVVGVGPVRVVAHDEVRAESLEDFCDRTQTLSPRPQPHAPVVAGCDRAGRQRDGRSRNDVHTPMYRSRFTTRWASPAACQDHVRVIDRPLDSWAANRQSTLDRCGFLAAGRHCGLGDGSPADGTAIQSFFLKTGRYFAGKLC